MHKRMTITLDEAVYEGLYRTVGKRRMSQFIEDLLRPQLIEKVIECTRALICRALRAAKDLRQDGERRSNASTYHIERNLFGDPRRVLCVVLLLFRNGAAHKVPFIRCRPLML